MDRTLKIWFIVASCIAAAIFFCGVAVIAVFGIKTIKFLNIETEIKTFRISEDFTGISVETGDEDLNFLPSEDGACKVVCELKKGSYKSVAAVGGTLNISTTESKKWYENISFFSFADEKITVYLPDKEYSLLSVKGGTGDISVQKGLRFVTAAVNFSTGDLDFRADTGKELKAILSTGNVNISEITCGSLALKTSTGNIKISDVVCTGDAEIALSTGKAKLKNMTCRGFVSDASTGDITLYSVLVSDSLNIKRSTGDVFFDSSDAGSIFIKTSTGDVTGTLKSDKVFITKTSTGKISVPESVTGGKCKVTTSTGDIVLDIRGKNG